VRRVFIVFAALVTLGAFVVTQTATTGVQKTAKKTKICHRTKSAKRPYVKITVRTKAALRAHAAHAADIIPAPAGPCPRTALTPTTGGVALTATMTGAAEAPGPADPDGTGTATIRLRSGQGQVCFTMTVQNITLPAAASHIHKAPVGQPGPIVVPLKAPGADGSSSGCVTANRTLVGQILQTPADYYVNVHTTDFPAGAIRGQLSS
jgi:CHRD domain